MSKCQNPPKPKNLGLLGYPHRMLKHDLVHQFSGHAQQDVFFKGWSHFLVKKMSAKNGQNCDFLPKGAKWEKFVLIAQFLGVIMWNGAEFLLILGHFEQKISKMKKFSGIRNHPCHKLRQKKIVR